MLSPHHCCVILNFLAQTEGNTGEFVELVVSGLKYIGPKDLTQYFIRNTNMTLGADNEVEVTVVLGRFLSQEGISLSTRLFIRRLLGTILTTFIPTFLLIVISYFSNFFKPFFFVIITKIKIKFLSQNRKRRWW